MADDMKTLAKIEKRLRRLESRCRVKDSPLSAGSEKTFNLILDAVEKIGGAHDLLRRLDSGGETDLDRTALANLPTWQGLSPVEVVRLMVRVSDSF
jgi:hypothetical protein